MSEKRFRNQQVLVRLTQAEHTLLSEHAEHEGLTLADFVRSRALGAQPLRARRRRQIDRAELAKLLGHVGHIGGNLNQIARNLNSDREEEPSFITDTLHAVRQMRDLVVAVIGVAPEERQ